MKSTKHIVSALAALSILTSAVGFNTFADEVTENSDIVIETVIEDEETATEENDTAIEENDTIIGKMIKSARKKLDKLAKEANSAKRSGKKCKPAEQAADRQEIAEGEENTFTKPERKAGGRSEQEIADTEISAEENTFTKPERKAGKQGRKNAEQTVDESITEEATEE